MPTVGHPGDTFTLNGRAVTRAGGRLTLADGTLAGSDLDMASAVRFAVRELGVGRAEALRMASLYPAALLRKDDRHGRIRPGYRADFVQLSDDNAVRSVWVGGEKI
jgi:N-acetylglucosamine-6-phosphate deacetylase